MKMIKYVVFVLAGLTVTLGSVMAEEDRVRKENLGPNALETTKDHEDVAALAFSFRYVENTKGNPILHYGDLSIPKNRLIATPQSAGGKLAISLVNAVDLAEAQLKNCQFLGAEIPWVMVDMSLVSYRSDGKLYWCWIATFRSADDFENEFEGKLVKVAVLLDGTSIAPIFKQTEITDPLQLIRKH